MRNLLLATVIGLGSMSCMATSTALQNAEARMMHRISQGEEAAVVIQEELDNTRSELEGQMDEKVSSLAENGGIIGTIAAGAIWMLRNATRKKEISAATPKKPAE